MRLNLGCGHNKPEGYTHVDISPECSPDVVFDLNTFPWPWEDDSVTEIMICHSLEHLGPSISEFFGIINELYRVCEDGAVINIRVPHPRHDAFICDPTHVRIITPHVLMLFDQRMNREWIENKKSNTPLGLQLGVDFRVGKVTMVLEEPYSSQFGAGTLTLAELDHIAKERNNIIQEFQIDWHVRKD